MLDLCAGFHYSIWKSFNLTTQTPQAVQARTTRGSMFISKSDYFSLALGLALVSTSAAAAEFNVTVPMHEKGMATYYVKGEIGDLGATEFMVDTGSSYLTINEQTLIMLQDRGQANYVKQLRAILANGSEMVIPVYAVNQLRVGSCTLQNIEAAVFPARTRQILGLSALNKTAPFTFSINPPELKLSNCVQSADASVTPATLAGVNEVVEASGNKAAPSTSTTTPLTN